YYETENYVRSAQLYEELIPVTKGTDRAEEVYYYFSWSEYYLGDHLLSQYHFKNYTRQFPMGKHVEECFFMSAYCYYLNSPKYELDQTNTKNAIREFQSFIDVYPESERVDSCNKVMDLLRLKLEKKDYEICKQYYDLSDWKASIVASKNYLREYPGSRFSEEMYYMMIESYYLLAVNSI